MSQQSFSYEPAPEAPARAVAGSSRALAGLAVRPARVAPPAPGDRRVRLTLAYDGAAFKGFATQVDVATVQDSLSAALSRVLRRASVPVTGAGRTDTGVHAWGQVVSFDVRAATDLGRLHRSLNGICGPGIVVREAAWAADDFDARFSALWRHYRYSVLNTPWPSPFLTRTVWHVNEPLDLAVMRLGCDAFVGEHDFSAFCRKPRPGARDAELGPASLVRRVLLAEWHDLGEGELRFDVRATAFCHQMVRSIVGTLVDVGRGRRRAGEVLGMIRSRSRVDTGVVAPAHGLCLHEVGY